MRMGEEEGVVVLDVNSIDLPGWMSGTQTGRVHHGTEFPTVQEQPASNDAGQTSLLLGIDLHHQAHIPTLFFS